MQVSTDLLNHCPTFIYLRLWYLLQFSSIILEDFTVHLDNQFIVIILQLLDFPCHELSLTWCDVSLPFSCTNLDLAISRDSFTLEILKDDILLSDLLELLQNVF